MRKFRPPHSIKGLLRRQKPVKGHGGAGPKLFIAVFFFVSALLISYLLPGRERTPQSPQPNAPSSSALSEETEPPDDTEADSALRTVRGTIGHGQTFAQALNAKGVSRRLTHEIARSLRPHLNFRKLPSGSAFQATVDDSGSLRDFLLEVSPIEKYEVTREGSEYRGVRREIPIERRVEKIAGTVTSSLFESMEALGEKPDLTLRMVDIFLWDFDFNSHARPGDEFRMLVEKEYADGRFVRYGKILIAEYDNRGKTYAGIYFEKGPGKGDYYNPDGRSVRKTFLRSPLRFTRISSRYTHRRRHPILGGVRPHLAVDYAAPHGTPVWAVADGTILSAGWKGGNGKTVLIQHRMGYRTMYNHLSRIARGIRKGARVRQKQVIGYVGSTGLSTGPHLDYRVIKNGHFVNPLTQKFIPGEPIPRSQQTTFRRLRDQLLEELHAPSPDPET